MTFAKQVEFANSRGVGQFHIFSKDGMYERKTWQSYKVAKNIADQYGCDVVNSDGKIVYKS